MSMSHVFEYQRPESLPELLRLKDRYQDQAKILAGGTDLIVNMKEGQMQPAVVLDIKAIPKIRKFGFDEDRFYIGAGITFSELIESPQLQEHYPMLWDAARTVASTGVRSRATLAGNICSAVPSLDSGPPLLCHEAVVHCESVSGARELPIRQWFVSPRRTALKDNEVVTGISLETKTGRHSGIYLKLGRYNGEDLAQAGWGFWRDEQLQYKIAHCALAPTPKRAEQLEALLKGKELCAELIKSACHLLEQEISPISDIRCCSEYRIHVSKVMLRRGLSALTDRYQGKTVDPRKLLGGIK
jgi:CO/xanthine dehydrogenase FAD-binding subunit